MSECCCGASPLALLAYTVMKAIRSVYVALPNHNLLNHDHKPSFVPAKSSWLFLRPTVQLDDLANPFGQVVFILNVWLGRVWLD
ncbi:MAG: hypothetical protein WBB01_02675 [Phormidesmis sp.]